MRHAAPTLVSILTLAFLVVLAVPSGATDAAQNACLVDVPSPLAQGESPATFGMQAALFDNAFPVAGSEQAQDTPTLILQPGADAPWLQPMAWNPPPTTCIPGLACSIPQDCPGGQCHLFPPGTPWDRRCICAIIE